MLNMTVMNYEITSKKNEVKVIRNRVSEEGNPIVDLVGFYPSLEMALRGIQNNYVLAEGTEIQTITDYKNALQEISDAFRIELDLQTKVIEQ